MFKTFVIGAMGVACAHASADYLAVTWHRGELWRLDERTGSRVRLGELGVTWRANAMERSSDGRYYVAADSGGSEWLFEIDPETGVATRLFSTGLSDVRSMAFAPDGTLRMVQYNGLFGSQIWTVDLGTQSVSDPVTLFGSNGANPGFQAFEIDAGGAGYMAGPSSWLRRVDIGTGQVSPLSGTGVLTGVQGLEFNDAGDLVGLGYDTGGVDARLWSYDVTTGAVRSAVIFERDDYRGVAWIVPSPGVPALLGLGGVVRARRRR